MKGYDNLVLMPNVVWCCYLTQLRKPVSTLSIPSSMKATGGGGSRNDSNEEATTALVSVHSEYPRYTEDRIQQQTQLAGGSSNKTSGGGGGGPNTSSAALAASLASAGTSGVTPLTTLGGKNKPNVGYRLGRRKALFEKRKRISDYALVIGKPSLRLISRCFNSPCLKDNGLHSVWQGI